MKVLNVNSLHKSIQSIHSEIETLHSQITALQHAVRGITELDAELKGRTGESIRTFYNQVHQPFLILLHQSLTDYAKVLDGIKGSVQAFEPDNQGYIDQDFMDGELRDGLDKTERMTNDLIEEINLELRDINDLISLDEMSMLELSQYLAQGHTKITTVMEGLYDVDHAGTKALSNVEKDLQLLENYLSDMTISFKNDAAIPNYNPLNAFEMGSYGEVWKKVYGNSTIKQNGLMDNVKDFVSDENSYKGVGLGLVDIGTDIVEGVIELFTNPMGVLSSVGLLITASQPGQVALRNTIALNISNAIINSYQTNVIHGDNESRARWFTYALGSVGVELIGLKGAGAVIRSPGTMTKIAGTTSKIKHISTETVKKIDISDLLPYSPQYQLAFDSYYGKVPYNALDGKNLVNQLQNKTNSFFDSVMYFDSKSTRISLSKNPRYQPGVVNESFQLDKSLHSQTKLMYNKGSIGVIPKEIRDQLIGKHFNSFDEFRKEFWKSVANSSFAKEFNNRNISRMSEGNAPIAPKGEHYGKHKSYILHHKQPIDKGGEVYNLDNILITSPKMHQNILDPAYHFGKKGSKEGGKNE